MKKSANSMLDGLLTRDNKKIPSVKEKLLLFSITPDGSISSAGEEFKQFLRRLFPSAEPINILDYLGKEEKDLWLSAIVSICAGNNSPVKIKFNLTTEYGNKIFLSLVMYKAPQKYSNFFNEILCVMKVGGVSKGEFAGSCDFSYAESGMMVIKKKQLKYMQDNLAAFLGFEAEEIHNIHVNDLILAENEKAFGFDLVAMKPNKIYQSDFYLLDIDRNKHKVKLAFAKMNNFSDEWIVLFKRKEEAVQKNDYKPYGHTTNYSDELRRQQEEIERLKEALENKERLLSVIGHDLRSPFTAVIGFADFVVKNFESLSSGEVFECCNNIQQSSQRIYILLEQLLKWIRIQRGDYKVVKEKFSVNEVVEEAIKLFEVNALDKRINLRNNLIEQFNLNADKDMISAVIRNLLSNALKFTLPKGNIAISAFKENSALKVYVEDDGIGMDEHTLNSLFKIGEKVTRPGTKNEPGTGMGLILTKEFLEKNNGFLEIESKVGEGSKFIVTIPLED